ncbi:hypothetical protein Tco_0252001 [Tanacetum coccineum]
MANSSSYKPSSPEITPKEEPVTLDKPERPNHFLPADQVEFIFEEIAFTTNNEVALLYPSHSNSEYSKGSIYQGPNSIQRILKFISLLLEYMMPEYENEELTINPTQVFGVHNWALKPNQTEVPPFIDHIKVICNLDVPVDPKAPKPSSQIEEVPQGKKPRAKSGLRRKQSSKHTSESKTEASNSKTGQSKKETQSSSAKDKSPSHPSPPTPVVGEMHKEAHQASGGPISLGATNEEGAHPQLSSGHDTLTDYIVEADLGLSAPNDSIPSQQGMDKGTKNYSIDHIFAGTNPSVLVDQTIFAGDGLKTAHTNSGTNEESIANEISKKIKLEDLSDLLKDTRSAFFTPDSLQDEPIIVLDESEEEKEVAKDKDTYASSHDKDELEQQKAKAKAEVASLKARPSYPDINQLTDLLHVKDMEIELPGDLKEIPTKLETFTSTISNLISQVAELKNIQGELPMEFQTLLILVSSVQKHLQTLDSLPSLLNKVTKTLNMFSTVVENALGDTTKDVPSVGQATASLAEGEKNTKDAETNLQNELVDLLGIDVVEHVGN